MLSVKNFDKTKIEWCDYTFNPWIGCAKVSTGCKNCYAERDWDKRYKRAKWGVNGTRSRTSQANWKKPLKWNNEVSSGTIMPSVFCSSLADVFEERNELTPWREYLFNLIDKCDNLRWLLLTKRPENVARHIQEATGEYASDWLVDHSNVWIGATAENNTEYHKRIEHLQAFPRTFLSCEPLLSNIKLRYDTPVQWVIAGGESGLNARAMNPNWVRSLRDQCIGYQIPFFFKQWGAYSPLGEKLGKKKAGKLLDGSEWLQTPWSLNI